MKKILITGASSGIGQSIGEYLHSQGHQVVGTSRNPEPAAQTFKLVKLDVTDNLSAASAVEKAIEIMGSIDVLINNAGIGISGSLEETSIEEAKWQFETNYFGVVRMNKQIIPHFRGNQQGMIINIGSLGGLIGLPFQGHYSASKFALEGYCEALRVELKPFGIKVCNICPGDFRTAFTQNRKLIQDAGEVYQDQFEHFLKTYENDEKNGSDPILIAKFIHKLLNKRSLKPRYIIGHSSQTIGIPIKRLIGAHLFEKVMMKIWGVS